MSSTSDWLDDLERHLQHIDGAIDDLTPLLEQLLAALPIDAGLARARLDDASGHGAAIRTAVKRMADENGLALPAWTDRQTLRAAAADLAGRVEGLRAGSRSRLLALADEIERGRVTHHRPAAQEKLDKARLVTAAAVRAAADSAPPPEIPDAGTSPWLTWWWAQPGPDQDAILARVGIGLLALADFLDDLQPNNWQAATEQLPAPPVTATPHTNGPASAPAPLPTKGVKPIIVMPRPPVAPPQPPRPAAAPPPAPPAPTPPPAPVTKPAPPPRPVLPKAAPTPPTPKPAPRPAPAPRDEEPTYPDDPPPDDPHLFDFAAFREHFWIAPGGDCRPAPWSDRPAFAGALARAQEQALRDADLLRLYLFSHAGATPELDPRDVRALAAVWAHPLDSAAGLDDARADRLRDAALAGAEPGPRWKLALLLEAARPTCGRPPIDHEEAAALLDAAAFHDRALEQTLRGLLEAAMMLPDAVAYLREEFRQRALETPEVLRKRFDRARETLHEIAKRGRLGAGGKIQRTHCRDAWDEFMSELWPELERMFPGLKSPEADWDVRKRQANLDRLAGRGRVIAEDGGVKFQDRGAFDRTAREIFDAARRVNDALDQLHRASGRRPVVGVKLPLQPAKALHSHGPLDDPLEELCRRALLRLIDPPEEPDAPPEDAHHQAEPLDITPALLADYPELLTLLPAGEPLAEGHAALFHADDVENPLAAAALLLSPAPVREGPVAPAELMERLRLHPDIDVTARAVTLFAQQREQGLAHARRVDRADQLRGKLAALNDTARALDMLAVDVTPLRHAIEAADSLVTSIHDGGEGVTLAAEWIKRLTAHSAARRDYQLGALWRRAQQEQDVDKQALVRKAIKERDYGSILPLLSGQWKERPDDYRFTKWRWRSEAAYGKPDKAARRIAILDHDVARAWQPLTGEATKADRPMRTVLARYVFGPYYEVGSENRPHQVSIAVPGLRKHINEMKANPCYLPQLDGYDHILLVTPAATLNDASIGDQLRKCIKEARESATGANDVITVVLVPQATAKFRREHAGWMRDQNAVLFDEYDLCRLLEPEGESRPPALLAFLELVFEQLAWKSQDPFGIPDGQHAALEMFVGRTEEARWLATENRFSRVFSGRKLGKSALLNFIRRTYDGKPLASGLTLKVVYVPAVGEDSEARIANLIIAKLRDIGFEPQGLDDTLKPADRLLEVLDRFPLERPQESLLLILDEADMFVEEQMREYARSRERCLSFRIRGQVLSRTDGQGLPRVRVLYSGYRATNINDGTWQGAGSDTLRLGPLPPAEAAALIAGPLARLGIDAGEQALAIAHRCGCQPIVLLRFGQCLLERLDQNYPSSARHGAAVKVTAEDVVEVFKSPRVQDEIHEMVLGNFQGNERGGAVFAALLAEFGGRGPGAALYEPEPQILARLDEKGPERNWLGPEEDPYHALNAELRDLVDRHLLVRKSEGDRTGYALKFPHHLPLLMQRGIAGLLMRQLRQARPAAALDAGRGFLPSAALDSLRQLLFRPDPEMDVRAVAVASLWPDAVEAPESPGNVADRIDPDHAAGLLGASDPRLADALGRPTLMVRGVSGDDAARVLAGRPAGLPPPLLLGGASLLRWALRQQRAGELVEAVGIGRLTPQVVRWWFLRVRGYVFDDPGAVGEIERRTAGIPLLLEGLDRLLSNGREAGGTVTGGEMRQALLFFDEDIGRIGDDLRGAAPALALEPREADVLRMVTTVSRENSYQVRDMAAELVNEWELYQELCPGVAAFNPSGDDMLALELVQALGLLPVKPGPRPLERLTAVGPDDPLWRVVAALGGAGS